MDPTWVLATLTGALVLVTGVYAYLNHRAVEEMRASRTQNLLPHIRVVPHLLGAGNGMIEVRNVGPGPASAVDVTVAYTPLDPNQAHEERTRVTAPLMTPGDFVLLMLPESEGTSALSINDFVANFGEVRLIGTYRDVLGNEYEADNGWTDLAAWWEHRGQAMQVPDYARDAAKELEKIRKILEKFRTTLERQLRG